MLSECSYCFLKRKKGGKTIVLQTTSKTNQLAQLHQLIQFEYIFVPCIAKNMFVLLAFQNTYRLSQMLVKAEVPGFLISGWGRLLHQYAGESMIV